MGQLVMVPTAVAGASSMGMYLSSNFSFSISSTNLQVTGFSAMTGFPNTVITSDKLVADGAAGWTVNSTFTVNTTPAFGETITVDIMQNSTVLVTGTIASGATSNSVTGTSATLANGDTIWMRVTDNGFFGTNNFVSGQTSTFVKFT